jgi:hypothetical protein
MKEAYAVDASVPVLEGRLESLAETADVLTGASDLGIDAFAAAFRDPRDALALPLLREDAAQVTVLAEAELPARLAQARRLLRRRADGALVQVEPMPDESPQDRPAGEGGRGVARVRLCVVAAAAPGERRDHVLARLAGAILCAGVLPLVVSGLADLAPRAGPVRFVAARGLAQALAGSGADWVLVLPAGCGVTPALSGLVERLDHVEAAIVAVQPAVALSPGARLSGVWAHEAGFALVRSSSLAGRALDSFTALQRAVRAVVTAAPAAACHRGGPSRTPALWRERVQPLSDAALRRLTGADGVVAGGSPSAVGAALVRRIVLNAMARTGEPASAIADALPAMLDRLQERVDGEPASMDVLEAALELALGDSPLGPVLEGGADGLIFRPDLAWDIDDYMARNPDLALRRLRGEAIDPVDHLIGEGAIEGRQIRRRQIPLTSFADDRLDRAALLQWTRPDDRRLAGRVRDARATRLGRALEAEGRLAAAAARAARIGDGAALRFTLTRCGHGGLVLHHLTGQGLGTLPAIEIGFIFDSLLPRPDAPGEEPAIVAAAFTARPAAAGLRAVDHAIRAGRYRLAADRLAALRERIDLPTHELLPRLHDLCDWPEIVRLAGNGTRPAFEEVRDQFLGLLYAGCPGLAGELLSRRSPSASGIAWLRGLAKFLMGDFGGSHDDFMRSVRLGTQPHFYHILVAQFQKLGQDKEAIDFYLLMCLVDRELAGSAIPAARFFERYGGAREGFGILVHDLVRHAGPFFRIQAVLFFLFRFACFMRRGDLATDVVRYFAAHPTAGSAMHEHERKQLGISFSAFAPRVAPLFRSPSSGVAEVSVAPADGDDLADLKALFARRPDTAFVFVGFQPGDTYLFLYAVADHIARLRALEAIRAVVIVSSRKVSQVAALFSHLCDELIIRDVPDYYVLKQMVADAGLQDRVVIGHFEFLEYDDRGRYGASERLVSHYVPSIKGPLGLPLDHAGVHPAPGLPSPIARTGRPRAFVAPMANSMPLLPDAIWGRVVDRLLAEGFEVFVNRGPNEPSLGTLASEFGDAYAQTLAFAHSCDVIVGLRSGLLDICSGSPARLVEVYNSHCHVGPFLYIWDLEKLRPGRDTRVVRVIEHLTAHDEIVERIVAAALGRPDPGAAMARVLARPASGQPPRKAAGQRRDQAVPQSAGRAAEKTSGNITAEAAHETSGNPSDKTSEA